MLGWPVALCNWLSTDARCTLHIAMYMSSQMKRNEQYFAHNCDKFKSIIIIFGKEQHKSKCKLPMQQECFSKLGICANPCVSNTIVMSARAQLDPRLKVT